jgi:hypothetical protein
VSPLERPTPPGGRAAEDELLATGWVTYEFSRRSALNVVTWSYEVAAGIDRASAEEVRVLTALVDQAAADWIDEPDDDPAEKWGEVEAVVLAALPPLPHVAVSEATDADLAALHLVDWADVAGDIARRREARHAA